MKFDDYKDELETKFPNIVKKATNGIDYYAELAEIQQPAHVHYKTWGFHCMNAAWSAAIPRSQSLTLEKWCKVIVEIDCWKMEVSCEAFSLSGGHVHITVRNKGNTPLPFTSTGYRSYFVDVCQFEDGQSVMDFLRYQLPETSQLMLF